MDSAYRGEIHVIMQNLGSEEVTPKIDVVESVSETRRGDGGFGSTGPRLRSMGRVSSFA